MIWELVYYSGTSSEATQIYTADIHAVWTENERRFFTSKAASRLRSLQVLQHKL